MPTRVLFCNPRGDGEFVRIATTMADDHVTPLSLQATLGVLYPLITVRPRTLDGEQNEVWYVYRDGRWVPGEHDLET